MGKILVVDDNSLNLKLVCDTLAWAGHEVLSAKDGLEAVAIATQKQPDLILMDLRMPVMDGQEAMDKIKTHTNTARIPVIALTASAMLGEREALLSKGFDGYISKPIDVGSFPDVIESFLARRD